MVTFEPAGRLGNWLLEFFCAAAYAFKHEQSFTVLPQGHRDRKWNPCYLPELVNSNFNHNLEKIDLWENGHGFQELPFEENWANKNIFIHGYRQSFKYCEDYRDEVLALLDDKWEMKKGVVSIHIRRGDYTNLVTKHIQYDIEYIKKSIKYFNELGYFSFKVYSDDIPFCREEFSKPDFSQLIIEFSHHADEWNDLMDLSCCEHHINSSSTFSLCAAWINRNKNKIIITPVNWFVEGWMDMDTSDIVPDNWIKM
jgi:hypothetical protein